MIALPFKRAHGWLAVALCALSLSAQTTTNLPPSPIVQVWGGGRHTMALLADGSVWTWGSDVSGKLGDNQVSPSYTATNNDKFLPLRVHGPGNVGYLNSIIAISAGEGHNLALKSDGTVWAWGWNGLGQLGNGTTNDAHTPVRVSGLTNVVAISGRAYHCLALKSDGTIWAWGWNTWGQLGTGNTNSTLVPVPVLGLTNPASISAGYTISLARMSNGTVEVWGTSTMGDLGEGSLNDHSYVPEVVNGLSNVVSASAGFQNPQVLKSDGTIWMWGWGTWGQLGDGATTNATVPTQVSALTNMVFSGATGDRDNCAIKADYTVWTWGRNYNGQLGIGTASLVFQTVPVQMPDFGNGGYVVMVQTPDWHTPRTALGWQSLGLGRQRPRPVGQRHDQRRLHPNARVVATCRRGARNHVGWDRLDKRLVPIRLHQPAWRPVHGADQHRPAAARHKLDRAGRSL